MSWLGYVIMGTGAFVAALMLYSHWTCAGPSSLLEADNQIVWATWSISGTLKAYCLLLYAQMYHFNLFAVYKDLAQPLPSSPSFLKGERFCDVDRMRRVVRYSVGFCCATVLIQALLGYLLWRSTTNPDVITNFAEDVCPWGTGTMSAALLAQGSLTLSACFCIALYMVQTRRSLLLTFSALPGCGWVLSSVDRFLPRIMVTSIIVCGLAFGSAWLTDVSDVISFVSGAVGTLMMFVMPLAFYKKSDLDLTRPCKRIGIMTVLGLATVAGFSNAILQLSAP